MMKGFKSTFFQSYVMNALFSSLFFFILLQVYLLAVKNPAFSIKTSLILSVFVMVLLMVCSIYFGIRNLFILNGKLSKISGYLASLRNGKFPDQLKVEHTEETARMITEVNLLGEYVQEQIKLLQKMSNEKLVLSEQVHTAAVIEERQRIARDLHDAVSQQLFALSMMSATAIKLFDEFPEAAREQLIQMADISVKAQGEMRALLMHLRPVELQKDSLCDGIIKLLRELKSKTNHHFQGSIDEVCGLTKAAEEHLFRIVQEAVSNIIRHAEAGKIKVELSEEEGYVHLFISDDGKGFDPEDKKMISYGIRSMKERCKEIGGVIQIRSIYHEGTYIDIKVPVKGGKDD